MGDQAGKDTANGGKCLVAWDKITGPFQYGGLGISNLQLQGWALRVRWLWMEKIDAPRPWAGLPLHVSSKEKAFLRQGDPLSPMLFIMVMDVLNSLVTKASELGLLQPLMRRGNGQRVSLYADDVVLFLQPGENELNLVKEILRIFGEASDLITNIGKCSMTPIQCNDHHIETDRSILPCNVISFPCKYLGLPLSVRKLSKHDFLELIDKMADRLPGWKASMINLAGRTTLVKAVLTAIPIYHLIALQCPKWVIKAIYKIRRGFLWKGRKDVKGGHCMVSWAKVCRPLDLGGLGLHNLEVLGWALSMR
jgi:hypothetical protein